MTGGGWYCPHILCWLRLVFASSICRAGLVCWFSKLPAHTWHIWRKDDAADEAIMEQLIQYQAVLAWLNTHTCTHNSYQNCQAKSYLSGPLPCYV